MTEKAKPKQGPEFFEQAMQSFEQAFKAGVKLQEETGKLWTDFFTKPPSVATYQKQASQLGEETVKTVQRQMEDSLKVLEECSRSSLDLFKKGVEASQSASLSEGQARLQKLWESSLQSLQANTKAMATLNQRILNAWMELARQGASTLETAAK